MKKYWRLLLVGVLLAALLPPLTLAAPLQQAVPNTPMQGINYGPFRAGQAPDGTWPTQEQIQEDMALLAQKADTVRIYSAQGIITSWIIDAAIAQDLQIVLQAWIGSDTAANLQEINAAAQLANAYPENVVGILVGSEVLLRDDLDEATLLGSLVQAKQISPVPVGYADVYWEWESHPTLLAIVDWVGLHSYGFWQCKPVEEAAQLTLDEWQAMQAMPEAAGKRVIVFETGWPNDGVQPDCPDPAISQGSPEAQATFTTEILALAAANDMDLFLFELADEPYKCSQGEEVSVGCHWGLLDVDRNPYPAWDGEASSSTTTEQWFVGNQAMNCRSGPGTDFQTVSGIEACTQISALEEMTNSSGEKWLRVESPTTGESCWLLGELLLTTPIGCGTPATLIPATPVPTDGPTPLPVTPVPTVTPPPDPTIPNFVGCPSPLAEYANPYNCPADDMSSDESVQSAFWPAWQANDYQTMLDCACVITGRNYVIANAPNQQAARFAAGECDVQPPGAAKTAFFENYWALSEMGVSWWVASEAFKGLGMSAQASQSCQIVHDNYSCAYGYEEPPSFWQVTGRCIP